MNNSIRKPDEVFASYVQEMEDVVVRLLETMAHLSHQISFCHDVVRTDFERIVSACQTFNHLVEQTKHVNIHDVKNPPEFWSHTRHDLRTPINGIKNYGEMILEDVIDDDAVKDKEHIIVHLKVLIQLAQFSLPIIDKIGKDFIYDEDEDDEGNNYAEEVWRVPEDSTVLIIDDNPDNTNLLKRRLEQAGLDVLVSHDGNEGIEMARENRVDLILLDILMPGLDGYQVLDMLKKDMFLSTIPVLMISSVSELNSIVRCIRAGADDYLPTPFNPILLRARITACLEKKKLHDREQESMRRLAAAQQQLTSAIESIDEGFAIFDDRDMLIQYNTPFNKIYQDIFEHVGSLVAYEDFLRVGLELGLFIVDRRKNETPPQWLKNMLAWHRNPQGVITQRLKSGEWISFQEYRTADGGTTVIHKNITDLKRKEDKLEFMALHDGLTGLVNRVGFEATLNNFIRAYEQTKKTFSLIYLDLDDFKTINDTLGHDFGDAVLKEVAHRLKNALREEDVVARLGGDEFAAIVNQGEDQELLHKILDRVFHSVGTEVMFNGSIGSYGLSAGVASFPNDAKDAESLIKAADEAMYAAKKAGKGVYRFFRDGIQGCCQKKVEK